MGRRVRAHALVQCLIAGVIAVLLAGAAVAQDNRVQARVLTIDPEQLFEQTQFGKRIIAESEALAAELQAENRRIEAELSEEERALTDKRPTLQVDEFRALANAFDEKVNQIRAEQDSKVREVQSFRETAQQRFFSETGSVLLEIVRERNAAVILDRRNVFLSAETVDITQVAIERIDAQFGDGRARGNADE